jgi:hypothetical protein
MKLEGIIKHRADITDLETFNCLPDTLKAFFTDYNGIVAYKGGLQIYACVKNPAWLSLKEAWTGTHRLFELYTYVQETDIPLARDCFGDQYLWRAGRVVKLNAEYGEVEDVAPDLQTFMKELIKGPADYLVLDAFDAYLAKGNTFEAGQLVNVFPPYTMNSVNERVFKAVPAEEQLTFLKAFYQQIKPLAEGKK